MNAEDEAIQTAKIAEFIKCRYEGRNLDEFSGSGSGTEEGRRAIRDSFMRESLANKGRLCQQCYERYKESDELEANYYLSTDWRVKEIERKNKPIESCTTEVERYMIPLPDRVAILRKEFGYNEFNEKDRDWQRDFTWTLEDEIKAIFDIRDPEVMEDALTLFGADNVRAIREDIKRDFIKDPNRSLPSEQELIAFMQKAGLKRPELYTDDFVVQYCKIFQTGFTKKSHYPKFTIIVHFSKPGGYWERIDVPERHPKGRYVSKCISSPIYPEYEE